MSRTRVPAARDFHESALALKMLVEVVGGGRKVFEGEDGRPVRRFAENLRMLFGQPPPFQLVVLESPHPDNMAVAAELIVGRIPAVLAMEMPLSNAMTMRFFEIFYNRLPTAFRFTKL